MTLPGCLRHCLWPVASPANVRVAREARQPNLPLTWVCPGMHDPGGSLQAESDESRDRVMLFRALPPTRRTPVACGESAGISPCRGRAPPMGGLPRSDLPRGPAAPHAGPYSALRRVGVARGDPAWYRRGRRPQGEGRHLDDVDRPRAGDEETFTRSVFFGESGDARLNPPYFFETHDVIGPWRFNCEPS